MYWFLMKYVFLGPILRLLFRPKARGLENIPAEGPAILAANHQSFLDDPVIPVAIVGTFEALPYDRKVPKPRGCEVRFGKPLSFERFYDRPADRFVLRSVTDELMYEIMLLSGQEYVDEYASKFKGPKAEE